MVHPQPAYPFRVRLELGYELGEGGLEVTCAVTNLWRDDAPFGIGFHPYLLAGPGGLDQDRVVLAASRRLLLDERGLPTGDEEVRGTAFDLDGRSLAGLVLDDCYTDLDLDIDGCWHGSLESAESRSEIWAEAAFAYAMCYTPGPSGSFPDAPGDGDRAHDLPPNALRTGTGLLVLRQGERWEASWGIAVLG